MNKSIEMLSKPRAQVLEFINHLSIEQLNKIPDGFNNNIIWNLGHIIAAQQGICYKRAGLNIKIDEDFFMAYRPDTKPQKFVDEDGVEEIKLLLFSTLGQLEEDCYEQIFDGYSAFTTRYGIELTSIDEAIAFLPFHEGLHIGYIMAMRKLV